MSVGQNVRKIESKSEYGVKHEKTWKYKKFSFKISIAKSLRDSRPENFDRYSKQLILLKHLVLKFLAGDIFVSAGANAEKICKLYEYPEQYVSRKKKSKKKSKK